MQAHREIARPVRPVRNFMEQQFIELRVFCMGFDHSFDHGADQVIER
jgi:hypothetical protein